jgi:hypothetical protein
MRNDSKSCNQTECLGSLTIQYRKTEYNLALLLFCFATIVRIVSGPNAWIITALMVHWPQYETATARCETLQTQNNSEGERVAVEQCGKYRNESPNAAIMWVELAL